MGGAQRLPAVYKSESTSELIHRVGDTTAACRDEHTASQQTDNPLLWWLFSWMWWMSSSEVTDRGRGLLFPTAPPASVPPAMLETECMLDERMPPVRRWSSVRWGSGVGWGEGGSPLRWECAGAAWGWGGEREGVGDIPPPHLQWNCNHLRRRVNELAWGLGKKIRLRWRLSGSTLVTLTETTNQIKKKKYCFHFF